MPEELNDLVKRFKEEAGSRKIMLTERELESLRMEHRRDAITLFSLLVKKYNITGEDVELLIETVPYL